jgi:hypothetical protein
MALYRRLSHLVFDCVHHMSLHKGARSTALAFANKRKQVSPVDFAVHYLECEDDAKDDTANMHSAVLCLVGMVSIPFLYLKLRWGSMYRLLALSSDYADSNRCRSAPSARQLVRGRSSHHRGCCTLRLARQSDFLHLRTGDKHAYTISHQRRHQRRLEPVTPTTPDLYDPSLVTLTSTLRNDTSYHTTPTNPNYRNNHSRIHRHIMGLHALGTIRSYRPRDRSTTGT